MDPRVILPEFDILFLEAVFVIIDVKETKSIDPRASVSRLEDPYR